MDSIRRFQFPKRREKISHVDFVVSSPSSPRRLNSFPSRAQFNENTISAYSFCFVELNEAFRLGNARLTIERQSFQRKNLYNRRTLSLREISPSIDFSRNATGNQLENFESKINELKNRVGSIGMFDTSAPN